MAHHRLGRHYEAIGCYQRALGLFAPFGIKYIAAETYDNLGEAHLATGEPEAARNAWRRRWPSSTTRATSRRQTRFAPS